MTRFDSDIAVLVSWSILAHEKLSEDKVLETVGYLNSIARDARILQYSKASDGLPALSKKNLKAKDIIQKLEEVRALVQDAKSQFELINKSPTSTNPAGRAVLKKKNEYFKRKANKIILAVSSLLRKIEETAHELDQSI